MTKIQTTSVWGVVKEKITPEQAVYGERNSPDTGGTMQNEEDELIGILGQPTPTRSFDREDIPVGQPPARIPTVPGNSGSSEVFRTETGQYFGEIKETPEAVKWVKTVDGVTVSCVATDTAMSFKWKKNAE